MSADLSDNRRERGGSRRPGPFDPGSEFAYDPSRVRRPEGENGPASSEVGPGPFDPEADYDAGHRQEPEAEVEPGPVVVPEPEPPQQPEPAPPLVPEPEPPLEPEPQPPVEPEPQPGPEIEPIELQPVEIDPIELEPADADAEPAEPEPEPAPASVDPLDPAPWVPAAPPRRRPPRAGRPTAPRLEARRPRRRLVLVALAAIGVLAAGVAWAADLEPTAPLRGDGDSPRVAAAGVGPGAGAREVRDEDPSSLAITSDAGPYHPVASDRKVDYGEADAKFGAGRYGRSHEGQDAFAKPGTPLVAVRDGVVVARGNDGGRGNYIGIYSPLKDETYVYLHMLKPTWLKRGERVAAGTRVGGMGCTGSCFGTHLHFEVRRGDEIENKAIDPLPMLKQWPQAPPLE